MIEVKNLVKRYGQVVAVDDLSFTIEPGRIYGFLGPNGAGKSTTMNILTGCLGATEGSVTIDGHDIFEEPMAAKKMLGYLPEMPPLYQDMTPNEYLRFVLKAKGVKKDAWDEQLAEVMNETRILDVQNRLIRNLSKGYRQRVGIAQALIGRPEVIILDEPTVGLDPKQIIEIRELIRELGKKHTVILSSHILSEVSAVCDSIMIISKGRLVASDTPDNLTRLFAGHATLRIEAAADETAVRSILSPLENLGKLSFEKTAQGNTVVSIVSDGDEDRRSDIFFAFAGAKTPILEMTRVRASLEDVFLELTQDKPDENVQKRKRFGHKKNAKEAAETQAEPAESSAPDTAASPKAAADAPKDEAPAPSQDAPTPEQKGDERT